ncbi:MAG TPA: hypothetical protein VMF67_09525 [Rhizomicrobium sp.]|nr:hypothetical protein [Rhizomicrobium sp.]
MLDFKSPYALLIFGYICIGLGVYNAILDFVSNAWASYHFNLEGFACGLTISAVGVLAIITKKNLDRLEARMDQRGSENPAVLHMGGVKSPMDAIRAAIVAVARAKR